MTDFVVRAELNNSATSVIIAVEGFGIEHASALLRSLTPDLKHTNPRGLLQVPVSWPLVIQLANVLGPERLYMGPNLKAWATAEVQRRNNPPELLARVTPGAPPPRDYQQYAARMIASEKRVMIFDEPGVGKTLSTLLGMMELRTRGLLTGPILAVVPASTMDDWVAAAQRWTPFIPIAYRGAPAVRKKLLHQGDLLVASYEVVSRDFAKALTDLNPQAMIVDECLLAGTPVSTPWGDRSIESLRPGDAVWGVDHTTGKRVVTRVRRRIFSAAPPELVVVNGVAMTDNHPVWTKRGYVPAGGVGVFDSVAVTGITSEYAHIRIHMPSVPYANGTRGSLVDEGANLLRSHVCVPITGEQRRAGNDSMRDVWDHSGEEVASRAGETPAFLQQAVRPDVRSYHGRVEDSLSEVPPQRGEPTACEQPTSCGVAGKSADHIARAWVPTPNGWERYGAHSSAEAADGAIGLAGGRGCVHGSSFPVPALLQVGHRPPDLEDRCGIGRPITQLYEEARVGREAGFIFARARVDRVENPEQASSGGDGQSSGGNTGGSVYNIETGTGNYIAGGLLVHNCGWICHPDTQRSRAVRTLSEKVEFLVGLSGTPITHTPKDLWSALYTISSAAFPSKERYIKRFLDDEGSLTSATDPEFRRCLHGQQRRVAKADVLTQLPPKNYTTRYVELPPAARAVYDAMENDMVAEVEGGEITAMGALAMLTRLNQLAAATGVVSTMERSVLVHRKRVLKTETHVRLTEPSWKIDVMMEVLSERDGHQTTVFSPSRQLIMLAGARAESEGMRVGYIVGEQKPAERTQQIEEFQNGKLDVMMATVGAGGIGITLTAASAVIFLQRPWSFVQATQAEDRQHRLGSERHESIDVIDIVAKDTVDARVRSVLRDKSGALSALLEDPRILSQCLGGRS